MVGTWAARSTAPNMREPCPCETQPICRDRTLFQSGCIYASRALIAFAGYFLSIRGKGYAGGWYGYCAVLPRTGSPGGTAIWNTLPNWSGTSHAQSPG